MSIHRIAYSDIISGGKYEKDLTSNQQSESRSTGAGGAVEALINFLLEENEKEPQAEFIVVSKYDKEAEELSHKFKQSKILYYKNFSEQSKGEILKDISFNVKFLVHKMKAKLSSSEPDTVRFYYYAYQMAKKYKVDYVVAEAGLYEQFEIFKKDFSESQLFAHLHRVVDGSDKEWKTFKNAIGVSEYISSHYRNGNDKIKTHTVYNCANDEVLKKAVPDEVRNKIRSDYGFSQDDFVVIFVGRVDECKGVRELAEAVLKVKNPHVKLMIVGGSVYRDSPDTEYVIKLKKMAELSQGRIVMTGYMDNSRLPELFAASDLCVVPSTYEEPLALVPLEAMSAGVPVIVTDSGGMKEYVKDGYPLMVHRGEGLVDELSEMIEVVSDDFVYREELIQRGNKRAGDFSRQKFYGDFLQVFGIDDKQ